MLFNVTHCTGCVMTVTRPHRLDEGDQKMGTGISWRHKYSTLITHYTDEVYLSLW